MLESACGPAAHRRRQVHVRAQIGSHTRAHASMRTHTRALTLVSLLSAGVSAGLGITFPGLPERPGDRLCGPCEGIPSKCGFYLIALVSEKRDP